MGFARGWFVVGSPVWNKNTKERGIVLSIKGTIGGKDRKTQVKWDKSGLTTWHPNKELTDKQPK